MPDPELHWYWTVVSVLSLVVELGLMDNVVSVTERPVEDDISSDIHEHITDYATEYGSEGLFIPAPCIVDLVVEDSLPCRSSVTNFSFLCKVPVEGGSSSYSYP